MKLIASLAFIILAFAAHSQKEQTISFDSIPIVLKPSGNGVIKLNRLSRDTIYYRGKSYPIKHSFNLQSSDIGYYLEYFVGCDQPQIPKNRLVVVEDYKSDAPKFWVDQNDNLNLLDDGKPNNAFADGEVILKLKNCKYPEIKFHVRVFRKNLDSADVAYLEDNFGKPGLLKTGTLIEEVQYWFSDQRVNVKYQNAIIEGKKVSIGLYDTNCDGLFTRNEKDKIMIQKGWNQKLSQRLVKGAYPLKDTTLFFVGKSPYDVVEIDKAGRFIKIKNYTFSAEAPIILGDTLKNYTFPIGDELLDLNTALGDKPYLLIDVWGTWCRGCVQQIPFIKSLHTDHSAILNIIGLNKGDSPIKMEEFKNTYQIPWKSGILSTEIQEDLNIEGFPSYILIDSDRKLLMYDTIPYYIMQFLEERKQDHLKSGD